MPASRGDASTFLAKSMMNRFLLSLAATLVGIYCAGASAQSSPEEVLVENGVAKITRSDFEADLLRLAPETRKVFTSDPKRVGAELNSLLTNKALAAEARKAGLDRDPQAQRLIALQVDHVLAQLQLRAMEQRAAAAF